MTQVEGNITYSTPPSSDGQIVNLSDDERRYLALRAWTLRKYGLTPELYEAKHTEQGGVCAICSQPESGLRVGRLKRLAVDHSRATGRVRDLLCCRCNQAIGLLREDPTIMRLAAAYIERHQGHLPQNPIDRAFERVPTVELQVRGEVS